MKRTINFLALIAIIITSQTIVAQNLQMSDKYSADVSNYMLRQYKSAVTTDVIPAANLQEKLLATFPEAKNIEWEAGGDIFEAEFEINSKDYKMLMDKDANIFYLKHDIDAKSLPEEIKKIAESKNAKYKFDDVKKIYKAQHIYYKIEMENGDFENTLFIRSDGKIVSEKFDID